MDFNQVISGRRSIREYTAQAVDERTIDLLIDAAVHAPNAVNQQPWTFTVVRNQRVLDRLSLDAKSHMLATMPASLHSDRSDCCSTIRISTSSITHPDDLDFGERGGPLDRRGLCIGCRKSDARRTRYRARYLLDWLRAGFPRHAGWEESARPSCGLGAGCSNHRRVPEGLAAVRYAQGAGGPLDRLSSFLFRIGP